jgi:hypothetical protein
VTAAAAVRVVHLDRQKEAVQSEIRFKPLNAVVLGVAALSGRVQLLDLKEVLLAELEVLEGFDLRVLAVTFPADLDVLNAGMLLPFALQCLT